MKIKINQLARIDLPLLVEPELGLENSNVQFEIYDESDTLMLSGSGSLTNPVNVNANKTRTTVSASFVVPETFDSEVYTILFKVETPDQLDYTTQTTLEVEQLTEVVNAPITYSLHLVPCVVEAVFPYLAHSRPSITLHDCEVAEGGVASMQVELSTPVNQPDTYLVYATISDTATLDDFQYTSGRLDFELGSTSAEIQIPTHLREGIQGDRKFLVKVLAVSNLDVFTESATVHIKESSVPTLTCENIEVAEEDGIAVFTLTLSEPYFKTVTVAHATQDGDALANVDYTPISGTSVIPKGTLTTTIAVPLIDQDQPATQYRKTFTLLLSQSNVTLSNLAATCTIKGDDYNLVEFTTNNIQVESGQYVDIPLQVGKLPPDAGEYSVKVNLYGTAVVNADFDPDSLTANPFVTEYNVSTGDVTLRVNSEGVINIRVLTLKRGVPTNPRYFDVTIKEVVSESPKLKIGSITTVRTIIYGD